MTSHLWQRECEKYYFRIMSLSLKGLYVVTDILTEKVITVHNHFISFTGYPKTVIILRC
ncbi:hypothetical protein J1N12_03205 [Marinilabiliaceae bacterium A049]|nr:hypothetical protein [Marinilabiliaceae bacterium A049]